MTFPTLSADAWIQVFYYTTLSDLKKLLLVSKDFYNLISTFKNSIFREYCNGLGVSKKNKDWESDYMKHYKLRQGQYSFGNFHSSQSDFIWFPNLPLANDKRECIKSAELNVLFAWPCEPEFAYTVATDENYLYWIDIGILTQNQIHVAILSDSLKDFILSSSSSSKQVNTKSYIEFQRIRMESLVQIQEIKSDFVLSGHEESIGLLLTNRLGHLFSYDSTGDIFVWDLHARQLHLRIPTHPLIDNILSMNVYETRVVAGGKFGKICVWNGLDGSLLHSVSIQDSLVSPSNSFSLLNVALQEDVLVYGLNGGPFYVYNLNKEQNINVLPIDQDKTSWTIEAPVITDLHENLENTEQEGDVNSNVEAVIYPIFDRPLGRTLPRQTPTQLQQPQEPQLQDQVEGELSPIRRLRLHIERAQQQEHQLQEQEGEEWIDPNASLAPLTLAVNSHVLLTNGYDRYTLILWDLLHGKQLYKLTESDSLSRMNYALPDFRSIRFAEISHDSSCIYSTVEGQADATSLILWDFESKRRKLISKVQLQGGVLIWLAFSL